MLVLEDGDTGATGKKDSMPDMVESCPPESHMACARETCSAPVRGNGR